MTVLSNRLDESQSNQHSAKGPGPMAWVFIGSLAALIVGMVVLVREAPARMDGPLQGVRIGVTDQVACHDPASCTVPALMGQVRVPGDLVFCAEGIVASQFNCHLMLDGRMVNLQVSVNEANSGLSSQCISATMEAQVISCQALSFYPNTNEILLGDLPGVELSYLESLRARYPLSQLSSFHWWGVALLVALLSAVVLFSGSWILTRGMAGKMKGLLRIGAPLFGFFAAFLGVVMVIIQLGYAID